MLKRLLLLVLLCAAFLLLMGLMVSSTAENLPQPYFPAAETAFLPVKANPAASSDVQAPSHAAFGLTALPAPLNVNTSPACVPLRFERPYFQIFYHAFHFSDRAG